jgi:hypothetical protein
MPGTNTAFLVAAYAIFWVALVVYIGWIALRLRGVRTDVEAVRELIEERDRASAAGTKAT